MPGGSFARRAALVVFGTCLGLALIESGLRVASMAMPLPRIEAGSCPNRVLCEGDSWTWGVGGRSYPNALQERLDAAHGRGVWCVVNAGIPGRNSAQIVRDLPEHLRVLRPQTVILLMGANDGWNPEAFVLADGGAAARVDRLLMRVRLYKFFRLLFLSSPEPESVKAPRRLDCAAPQDDPALLDDEAIPALEACLARDPRAEGARLMLGWRRFHRDGLDAAMSVWKAGLAFAPASEELYFQMGEGHNVSGNLEGALHWWRRGLAALPSSERIPVQMGEAFQAHRRRDDALRVWRDALKRLPRSAELHFRVADELERNGEEREARGHWVAAVECDHSLPGLGRLYTHFLFERRLPYFFELVRTSTASGAPGVRAELERLRRRAPEDLEGAGETRRARTTRLLVEAVGLASGAGARVIVASYPNREHPWIEKAARRAGSEFVPLGELFAARFHSRADWIAYDREHANTRGYAAMAEIFAGLLDRGSR